MAFSFGGVLPIQRRAGRVVGGDCWITAHGCYFSGHSSFRRRYPYLVTGWLWYLGTLVPVIGLVQVGMQAMADRYTYVPLIGLFAIVAWGIPDLLGKCRYRNVFAWGVRGANHFGLYGHNEAPGGLLAKFHFSLPTYASVTGGHPLIHNNLGVALTQQGRDQEALAHFGEAFDWMPIMSMRLRILELRWPVRE